MKKVYKNFIVRPQSLTSGRKPYDKAIKELEDNRKWCQSALYRSKSVKQALDGIYFKKCAFCNQIPKGSPLQVEHFRPKDGIKNESSHTGYYWLGLEWTNLLFSCGNCNVRKSTYFKLQPGIFRISGPQFIHDKFDLNSNLCFSTFLRKEKYELVNPELDNPDDHLLYLPSGQISHKTQRGEHTIEILHLNRDELYIDGRKKIIDNIVLKILNRLKNYPIDGRRLKDVTKEIAIIITEEIIYPIENKESFDHFLFAIYNRHEVFILQRITNQIHKNIIHYVFCQLKQGLNVILK